MDNAIFAINGKGQEMLARVIQLRMDQNSPMGRQAVVGWRDHSEKGLVLYWTKAPSDMTEFPAPVGSEVLAGIAMAWLEQDQTWQAFPFRHHTGDLSHDGSNEKGWLAYCEDWGHVDHWSAFLAIAPAWLWLGK